MESHFFRAHKAGVTGTWQVGQGVWGGIFPERGGAKRHWGVVSRGGALTQPQHALPFRLVVQPLALVDVAIAVVHASPPAALVAAPLTLIIVLGSVKLDPIALKEGKCPTICQVTQVSHLSFLESPAIQAEVKEF